MLSGLMKETLVEMDQAIVALSAAVPAPQAVPFNGGTVFRHVEQLPQQAIVQKVVRLPSGLRAAQLLLENGFLQEQASLQRVIDEISEDVIFLSIPLIYGGEERIHEQYRQAFFAEEYDHLTGLPTAQHRPMVRRQKIRAYIARSPIGTSNPSGYIDSGKTLSKVYSGFVHAASPHIMDMYGGHPPRFHTAGMLGTAREIEHRQDIVNFYYRSVVAFTISSRALGHKPAYQRLFNFLQRYETAMRLSA